MPTNPTQSKLKLADLVAQLDANEILVNPRYQRSGQIWPSRAKSFLVETVLLGKPIPRVLLHKVDSPTPPHHSDIIDGQQRCTILQEFRQNGFELSADIDTEALQGKSYAKLPARYKKAFDDYEIPIDEYRGVTHKQIRQVFRRLNYYTAPLNAAEQRHAQFYGELGSFVEKQSALWEPIFRKLRVFTKKQFRRKADQQLMAEIVDAMLNGITTPTAKSLRTVYQQNERQFPSVPDFTRRLDKARAYIDRWERIRSMKLRKHYQIFSFILAVIHAETDLATLRSDLGKQKAIRSDADVLRALEALDRAVRLKSTMGRYAPFWAATHEKTNVQANRLRRCEYFYAALTG
jgi:uncharacterized protein DUF262